MKNSIYIFTFAVSLNAQTFQQKISVWDFHMNNLIKLLIYYSEIAISTAGSKLILQEHISIKIVLGLSKLFQIRSVL